MVARTLNQILTELNPTFSAENSNLQQQSDAIPQQIASQTAGLNAQKDSAFGDILNGARSRGLGFSGIPLGEQAKYTATNYLPALANLQQQGNQQQLTLQQAMLGNNERRDTLGQQIYQQDQDRAFQQQQAEAARRASAAASASPTFGGFDLGSLLGGGGQGGRPQISRTDKGYNFTDAYGTPINAAEYVQLYQQGGGQLSYRNLLQQMANNGDKNAKVALNYVGDDYKFGNAPSQFAAALKALGATGTYAKAAPIAQQYNPASGYQGNAIPRGF